MAVWLEKAMVEFTLSDGSKVTVNVPPIDDRIYIKDMTLVIGAKPIVRNNFAFHDDSRQIHTICRRNSDKIDTMEW